MADFWDQSPNFTNPQYASPEQLAQQRRYAEELQKRSGGEVNRPAGALANMIDALTAGLTRNNANQIQSQAAQGNAADIARLAAQLQAGQFPDPQTQGHLAANPMASPEMRGFVGQLTTPQAITSGLNQPGYTSPNAGVTAPPIRGQYQPATPMSQATEGNSISGMNPTPNVQTAPLTPTNPQGGMYGGLNFRPAPAPPPGSGGPAAGAGLPPAPPPVGPNGAPAGFPQLDALAAKGRQLAAEKARSQGGAMGEAENIKTTVMNAPAAKNAIQDASVMEDLIKSNPKMPFGPWAKITNETLRVIHNVTGDKTIDAKSLAASDAVEKLNLSMAASMQQKWNLNPSSISLAQGSTPGNEKSRPGTLDLLGLIKQGMQRDYDVATKLYPVYAQAGKLSEFPQAVTDYYKEHPLQNPNTGHLVMDPIPVKSPADTKGLRPGTPIKLPDGRVGWVPNG